MQSLTKLCKADFSDSNGALRVNILGFYHAVKQIEHVVFVVFPLLLSCFRHL